MRSPATQVALLDEEGNPAGNRVTRTVPASLLRRRDNAQVAKVLALVQKFV